MNYDAILKKLKSLSNPKALKYLVKYGINPKNNYGISIYTIRDVAKDIGTGHRLAQRLWNSGIHDARLLASMIDDPKQVTESQMEKWARDFDSWDVCDQVCSNLFDKTIFAYTKAHEWTERKEEFVKRAGFVLMAVLAVHDKKADDKRFEEFFKPIKRESTDERNYVKKAVNWALRGIGKRNLALNKKAIAVAKEIKNIDSSAARWIASDALRELKSEKIRARMRRKEKRW